MDRRKSIGLIGIGSLLFTQNAFPAISESSTINRSDEGFMKGFAPRWNGLQTHTFEVFEAMPEAQFGYQPTEEIMSFSRLFTHIGKSLDIYAGMLDGISYNEETDSSIKGEVRTYLMKTFERFEKALTQLNRKDIYTPTHEVTTRDGSLNMSDYDIIMLAYNHTVHHKGQATTYLRLSGIAPPQYRY